MRGRPEELVRAVGREKTLDRGTRRRLAVESIHQSRSDLYQESPGRIQSWYQDLENLVNCYTWPMVVQCVFTSDSPDKFLRATCHASVRPYLT